MLVESLREALEKSGNQHRAHLLKEVDGTSDHFMGNIERLVNICSAKDYFIYSFYEQNMEQSAVLVSARVLPFSLTSNYLEPMQS